MVNQTRHFWCIYVNLHRHDADNRIKAPIKEHIKLVKARDKN